MEHQDQPTLTSPQAIGPDAPTIAVQIGPSRIDAEVALALVARPEHGASVVILGATGSDQAKGPTTATAIRRIVADASMGLPGDLAILSRTGEIAPGDARVAVAASAAHRADAFAACRTALRCLAGDRPATP